MISSAKRKNPFDLQNQKKLKDIERDIFRLNQERESIRSEAKSAFVNQVINELSALGMTSDELVQALTKSLTATKPKLSESKTPLKSLKGTTQKNFVAKGKKNKKVTPKFRNPENPTETWSGRGRKPRWVENQLKLGATLVSLEVRAEKGDVTKHKVAPKYINPANPTEMWTGRGRKPLWIEQQLKSGSTLDMLKI